MPAIACDVMQHRRSWRHHCRAEPVVPVFPAGIREPKDSLSRLQIPEVVSFKVEVYQKPDYLAKHCVSLLCFPPVNRVEAPIGRVLKLQDRFSKGEGGLFVFQPQGCESQHTQVVGNEIASYDSVVQVSRIDFAITEHFTKYRR